MVSTRPHHRRILAIRELSAITRPGGRPRTGGTDAERVRKVVGNRIRLALTRIEAVHPELGRHLQVAVRTGSHCRYAPEHPVEWAL